MSRLGTLKKTIVWRILSFTIAIVTGRIWFGDWHVSLFTVYISIQMMLIYYIFERIWGEHEKGVKE